MLRAVSGTGLQAAANAYGEGKGREARKAIDDGREELLSLGNRYGDLEGVAPLARDLRAMGEKFDAAPSASEDGLYLAKKAKEEARELRSR